MKGDRMKTKKEDTKGRPFPKLPEGQISKAAMRGQKDILIRVDLSVFERLFKQSERLGVSMSSYLRMAIIQHLEQDEAPIVRYPLKQQQEEEGE